MKISEARFITGYEKLPYYEQYDGGKCDYCGEKFSRSNQMNEKRTSYEYDEVNTACSKCVKSMAKSVNDGVDIVVGMF